MNEHTWISRASAEFHASELIVFFFTGDETRRLTEVPELYLWEHVQFPASCFHDCCCIVDPIKYQRLDSAQCLGQVQGRTDLVHLRRIFRQHQLNHELSGEELVIIAWGSIIPLCYCGEQHGILAHLATACAEMSKHGILTVCTQNGYMFECECHLHYCTLSVTLDVLSWLQSCKAFPH